ncbi:MAG: DUF885 family protein [Armatimonadetes bacterium]|nr:DUF885 family protein [Armatimonadota bacterium]
MQHRIQSVSEDLDGLRRFYNINSSPNRVARFETYYKSQLTDLKTVNFDGLDRESQIDYLLLKHELESSQRRLSIDARLDAASEKMRPFSGLIIDLCEARQQMKPIDPEACAAAMKKLEDAIKDSRKEIEKGLKMDKTDAYRGANILDDLKRHLEEWFKFYNGYDPMFSWWVQKPYESAHKALEDYIPFAKEKLVGIKGDDTDTIIGSPIGVQGLKDELQAELIAYSPQELLDIAEKEFAWCETEMKKASREMGFGDDWKKALEKVKNDHVAPGEQPEFIRDLALEAIDYVKKYDLVTVPPLAEETWRMVMMSPERQKVSPFFLGGDTIMVSFPTNTMDYDAKLMSMRGNNKHFARATVFHELIPGHHLQQFMNARYRPYRQLFDTPFWIEGWALYWEMVLWDRGFTATPEDRVGALFWRMHRCARIVFSLKFHMGQMTPQQCVDYLVEKVGHERSTAEGEVRRSFNGSYPPLYQAAYMLGALQIRALRKEMVEAGKMTEKQFHDQFLQENEMPIEILRALMSGQKLTPDFKATWRFYPGVP